MVKNTFGETSNLEIISFALEHHIRKFLEPHILKETAVSLKWRGASILFGLGCKSED